MSGKRIAMMLILAVAFVPTIASEGANAQLIPVLGGQRAGTSSAQFLKIGVGGRATAMGDAFVAVANDASALYWNPAGIAQFTRNSVILSHVNWLVDVKHEFIGYVHHFSGTKSIGIQMTSLHTEDMAVTTEFQPYGTGEYFSFSDVAIGVTLAGKLTDRFSFGGTIKYMDETLDNLSMSGWMIDFGTYYWTGAGSGRFAVAVTNFGNQLTPEGEVTLTGRTVINKFQSFSPPTIFRVAYAQELYQDEEHKLTSALQLNHPNDNSENVNLGLEYWWNEIVSLRAGYKFNVDEESLSLGAGVNLPLQMTEVSFDYAYSSFGLLGSVNRFSLNIMF